MTDRRLPLGTKVKFTHQALGELSGTVVKSFKNGKLQVECGTHFSGQTHAIRKTTYNVASGELIEITALR